jgi:uncharacterized membrane protein (UPF0127 family)
MTYIKMTLMRTAVALTLFLGAALLAGAQAQTGPQPRLPTTRLVAGMHVIVAEVAAAPEEQRVGMMFRRSMGTNEGMLFVNAEAGVRCFWMRNTLLPLSIAFIADDGTIVNLADMEPQSDQSHCSAKPVRYALEMNQGWFAKRGIAAGFKLRGAPFGNP